MIKKYNQWLKSFIWVYPDANGTRKNRVSKETYLLELSVAMSNYAVLVNENYDHYSKMNVISSIIYFLKDMVNEDITKYQAGNLELSVLADNITRLNEQIKLYQSYKERKDKEYGIKNRL